MFNRKRFVTYFLVVILALLLYLPVKEFVSEKLKVSSKIGESQVSNSQPIGAIFSTDLGNDEINVWVTQNKILINPFETQIGNLSSFSISKDSMPELFVQREHGMNAITARAFRYGQKNFIILANNKPDHGAYSIDFAAVFDLETGKNVYKTSFPIEARSPLLEFKEGELVFTSYPKECSGEYGYEKVFKEYFARNEGNDLFEKVKEECS